MEIIDLSMPIEPHFRWPVDLAIKGDIAAGDPFRVSRISMTCHGFSHVDAQAHVVRLRRELDRAIDVAQRADDVRAAARDDIGLAPLGAQLVRDLLHRGGHVGRARIGAGRRAEDVVQKDVARPGVGLVGVAGAVLQQDQAFEAGLRGGGSRLAGMVRLRRALGNDDVGALFQRVGDQEFQLAGLVAAGREPGAVVALDPQDRAPSAADRRGIGSSGVFMCPMRMRGKRDRCMVQAFLSGRFDGEVQVRGRGRARVA